MTLKEELKGWGKTLIGMLGVAVIMGGCAKACSVKPEEMRLDTTVPSITNKVSYFGLGQLSGLSKQGVFYRCGVQNPFRQISFLDSDVDGTLDAIRISNFYNESFITNSVELKKWENFYQIVKKENMRRGFGFFN